MSLRQINEKSAEKVEKSVRSTALTRRQARAMLRAYERRRRQRWLISIGALILVVLFALLFKDRIPNFGAQANGAKKGTVCPTPTTVIGPDASTAPATPPPTSLKPVNGDQGLQYIDLKVGCGDAVKEGDNITVNYSGWTAADNKLFDSSYNRHQPFPVQNIGQAQLIQGWNIGLIGMKPGGTRRLIIPPSLGYGDQGAPPTIPPNATLIFDVTLVSIDTGSTPAVQPANPSQSGG